ncbi:hypothetical protein N0V94_008140 [Neodidymelliopsis sp. IMI 364377]|nr:hypothetical protein N0V94_008140 [Neodidymelliopsis sp. IMI 364377]
MPKLYLRLTLLESPKVFGSLTLGGYDDRRFEPNNNTFPFDPDDERPLSLTLQQITARNTPNGSISLLDDDIYVNLDFTLPYLYLPPKTCDLIASLFDLEFDNTTNLYLAGNNKDAQFKGEPPRFTFDFGDSTNGAQRVSVVLPYAALDLHASWPLYNDTRRYFPIRRGSAAQYTLAGEFFATSSGVSVVE